MVKIINNIAISERTPEKFTIDYENGYFCEVKPSYVGNNKIYKYNFVYGDDDEGYDNLIRILDSEINSFSGIDSTGLSKIVDSRKSMKADPGTDWLQELENFDKFEELYGFDSFIEFECLYNPYRQEHINPIRTIDLISAISNSDLDYIINKSAKDIIDKVNSLDWVFTKLDYDRLVSNNGFGGNILTYFKFPTELNEKYLDYYTDDEYYDNGLTDKILELMLNYEKEKEIEP